jgi:hypothetical protein
MVRKLEVIFGLDPVAGKLGVAGHILVLLEQLRGISADALVAAVAAATTATTAADTLRTLTPTTPTAAALAIVHQAIGSLTTSAELFLKAHALVCRTANRSLPGAPSVVILTPLQAP